MKKFIILAIALSMTAFAQANSSQVIDPYYEISDFSVEKVEEGDFFEGEYVLSRDTEIGDVIATAREIIAFGKEIYKIIEAGKPVINTNYAPISVLPLGTKYGQAITPMNLNNWQSPKFAKFKVTYKNGYGAEVVSFTYNVNMSYGGKFGDQGAYITNAQIVPENVNVLWGYTFNAKMSLVGLTNTGSDEDPVAGATLSLSYSVSTVIREDRNNMTIYIDGNGTIQQM